jgi:hypothetical protein
MHAAVAARVINYFLGGLLKKYHQFRLVAQAFRPEESAFLSEASK